MVTKQKSVRNSAKYRLQITTVTKTGTADKATVTKLKSHVLRELRARGAKNVSVAIVKA